MNMRLHILLEAGVLARARLSACEGCKELDKCACSLKGEQIAEVHSYSQNSSKLKTHVYFFSINFLFTQVGLHLRLVSPSNVAMQPRPLHSAVLAACANALEQLITSDVQRIGGRRRVTEDVGEGVGVFGMVWCSKRKQVGRFFLESHHAHHALSRHMSPSKHPGCWPRHAVVCHSQEVEKRLETKT